MKKHLIFIALFGLSSSLFAQIPQGIQNIEIEKPVSPAADIDFILAPMDKSNILSYPKHFFSRISKPLFHS